MTEAPDGGTPRGAISGAISGRRSHRLFGLTLASSFAFASRLSPGRGDVDLTFSVADRPPYVAQLGDPVYESPLLDPAGDSLSRLYRLDEGELLRFGDALDFYLGGDRIDCHLRRAAGARLVEVRLLGPVLAYWLERLAICALHASAVVVAGRVVAFMAGHRGGKTALAAAMMAGGAPLLCDDLLAIEAPAAGIVGRSGYPQMRMRPDGLAHFVTDPGLREASRVQLGKHWVPVGEGGFGDFHAAAAPLGRLYLPERLDGETAGGGVRISPVPARQAVVELLRRSFSPYIVEAAGLQAARLEAFARLVREVPVRRLVYPPGMAGLPAVREAVLADLERS